MTAPDKLKATQTPEPIDLNTNNPTTPTPDVPHLVSPIPEAPDPASPVPETPNPTTPVPGVDKPNVPQTPSRPETPVPPPLT